jgi:hypothetical protein
MLQMREAIGFAAVLAGVAALSAVNHHPTTGRHIERERAAVQSTAWRFTHQQIADAWTEAKIGNAEPLRDIQRAFPLPVRTVYEDGSGIVFTFAGHGGDCIDFTSGPERSIVSARHC